MAAVIVEIGADATAFQKAVDGLHQMMRRASSGLQQAIGGIGLGLLMKQSLDTVVSMDRLRRGMSTLEGSAEGAEARLADLRETAKLPGVDFEQAVKADIKLRAVGVSADISKQAIIQFGNALSLAGGTASDLDGVILALTQIISKGKVSAEEINQIAERVPQVRRVMQNVFGTSDTDALQKMKMTAEEFVTSLIGGFSELDRATAGLDEQMSDINTSIKTATDAVMSGFIGESIGGMSELSSVVQDNIELLRDLGGVLGDLARTGVNTFRGITDSASGVAAAIGLAASGDMSIGDAFANVSEVLANKQTGAASAAGGASGGVGSTRRGTGDVFQTVVGSISRILPEVIGPVAQVVQAQLMEQSKLISTEASALRGAAFGGLRGDVDTSYGRGTSINPLNNGAARMVSEMVKQSALLQAQARSMDKGNGYLAEIEKAVKKFNTSYQ